MIGFEERNIEDREYFYLVWRTNGINNFKGSYPVMVQLSARVDLTSSGMKKMLELILVKLKVFIGKSQLEID